MSRRVLILCLALDFGSYGIFVRYNDSTWSKLHSLSAEDDAGFMVVED